MPGEADKLFPLRGNPGIKRDTTDTEGGFWTNGIWTRFYRGLPRSIGGYRDMTDSFPGPSRGLYVNAIGNGFINVHSGSANQLVVGQFTAAGIGSSPTDRTPSGFATSPLTLWQLDSIFNSNGGGGVSLVAHGPPNLGIISNNVASPVYIGDINAITPLIPCVTDATPVTTFEIDGGILCVPPYLTAFGSDGLFCWTNPGVPNVFPVANAANICPDKIVCGRSIRGGANNPSGLLWSLSSLIQFSFVGLPGIWNFNTLSDQSSILSSSCVVEMDGIYYWIGVDRFLTFNGILQELPNELCLDFFFDNLNYAEAQKVYGYKIPRWGEIHFCAPLFGATECNWDFIYNAREKTWYSTPLPSDGRSAAYFAQTFTYPIMASANGLTPIGQNSGVVYPLWQHEIGVDAVRGSEVDAILSSITSPPMSLIGGGLTLFASPAAAPEDQWTEYAYMEPDLIFGPSLNLNVLGREYPQDTDVVLDQKTIIKQATGNSFDLQTQQRYMRWVIESNVGGGFYILGQSLMAYRPGDRSR